MEVPRPEVQRLIDLVRRRDILVEQKKRATQDIDREIDGIDNQLAAAGGIIVPQPAGVLRQTRLNLRVRPGSNAEKLLLALARNAKASIGELAIEVYGSDDDDNRHKVRAVQFHLRKTGRLPKLTDGAP